MVFSNILIGNGEMPRECIFEQKVTKNNGWTELTKDLR